MSPHERHEMAFGFAGVAIQEAQDQLQKAKDKINQAVMATRAAVGTEPLGAGLRAMAKVEAIQLGTEALISTCEEAKREMNAYGRGW